MGLDESCRAHNCGWPILIRWLGHWDAAWVPAIIPLSLCFLWSCIGAMLYILLVIHFHFAHYNAVVTLTVIFLPLVSCVQWLFDPVGTLRPTSYPTSVLAMQARGFQLSGLLWERANSVTTHALQLAKCYLQLRLFGSVEPIGCRPTWSLLAVHKHCSNPRVDLVLLPVANISSADVH